MKKGQRKGTGKDKGSWNGPDPKVQVKISTALRDRITTRCKYLGVSVPEYVRRCILNDLEKMR